MIDAAYQIRDYAPGGCAERAPVRIDLPPGRYRVQTARVSNSDGSRGYAPGPLSRPALQARARAPLADPVCFTGAWTSGAGMPNTQQHRLRRPPPGLGGWPHRPPSSQEATDDDDRE